MGSNSLRNWCCLDPRNTALLCHRRTCTEYLEPLQEDGSILSPDAIDNIFGNINILVQCYFPHCCPPYPFSHELMRQLGLNETLYNDLVKTGSSGNIGRVFITFAPLLKSIYAYMYCSDVFLYRV